MVIDAKQLFLLIRTHHGFPPQQREQDLRRLQIAAADPNQSDFVRRWLSRFVERRRRPASVAQMS